MTPRANLQCTGHHILRATHCFVHMTCNQRPPPPECADKCLLYRRDGQRRGPASRRHKYSAVIFSPWPALQLERSETGSSHPDQAFVIFGRRPLKQSMQSRKWLGPRLR